MQHVRLMLMAEDLPRASLALAETEQFHPDTRLPEEQALVSLPGRDYRDTFTLARSRLDKIAKIVALEETPVLETLRVIDHYELETLNNRLGELWQETSRLDEDLRSLDAEDRLLREQEAALANFANLKVDLGALKRKTRFLDFYIGLVPRENVSRLEGAVALAGHLLLNYLQRDNHAHVVIIGPSGERENQLGSVLSSAGFQALPIPDGIIDKTPAELEADFRLRHQRLEKNRAALQQQLANWRQAHADTLIAARETLLLAEPLITLDPSIHGVKSLAVLCGWVPARALSRLRDNLQQQLQQPFALEARHPTAEERPLVPTVPTHNALLTPFSTLVKQYGIPQYGEIDPTPLFALTFLLMFGMMFGDVGHGAVIALAAYLARDKLKHFATFGIAAGVSSMLFGFVFGSIFGVEHWLPALWMPPLENPILMLEVALIWGIVFIIAACSLGIYNRFAVGNIQGALLAPHGLVNLLFYLGFLNGGWNLATEGSFGLWPALVVVGALLTLAVHQWRHLSGPTGEKVLIVVIETLDTVIVYLSNTLSFLRVSAFSLNHAALAIAIFTLADMLGTFGTILTLILGNLFILVLEGGIVMIQVMRLQYYEGFSRYFSGDGHEFAPLRLQYRQPAAAVAQPAADTTPLNHSPAVSTR
ncbi:V-type ATP synthase subunit I [Rhabdochromatium marinum]|uniref:V-type ATP synthase subunit I n=1 Tax=Rhabdochromatium marinum TaxID=48729 RepID=UPI001902F638|nr:V-type ATPase 116kDa subunit family protein [Rhabdochromatium marinum]